MKTLRLAPCTDDRLRPLAALLVIIGLGTAAWGVAIMLVIAVRELL